MAGVGHQLPLAGQIAYAVSFLGLDGGQPSGGGQQNGSVVGAQSGRCLDVPNASTTNGTQVQLYDCASGSGQRWTYTSGKQLTVSGTKCLDANGRGTSNGTAVIIWDCNGGANQQWTLHG